MFWDAHRIEEQVGALLRDDKPQAVVNSHHIDGVARIVRCNGSLVALHLVKNLVHDVCLHHRLFFLEHLGSLIQLQLVLGVDAVSQAQQRDGKGIARVGKLQDLFCVVFIPHDVPAVRIEAEHVVVIDQSHCSPGIRHRVKVLRVIGGIFELFGDVLEVWDILKIQRFEHVLVDHTRHHIVGREDDVIGGAAAFELCIQRFVGIKLGIVDADACQLLKQSVDVQRIVVAVGNIFAPVVDIDGDILAFELGVVVHVIAGGFLGSNAQRHRRKNQHRRHHKSELFE